MAEATSATASSGPVTVAFEVPFAAGQHRPRFSSRPFPHMLKPDADRERERDVAAAFCAAAMRAGLGAKLPVAARGVPVTVSVRVFRHLPKSTPKGVAEAADTGKPDADNVAKLVMDALNGCAYEDDAQVTSLRVTKMPRSRIQRDRMEVEVFYGRRDG